MKKVDLDILQTNQEIEPTGFDGLFLLPGQTMDHQILKQYLDELHQLALENKQDDCFEIIQKIIPEYKNLKD